MSSLDELLQRSFLLKAETTEIIYFWKSIIVTEKNANEYVAFLFVLSIYNTWKENLVTTLSMMLYAGHNNLVSR